MEARNLRRLVIKAYHVTKAEFSKNVSFNGGILGISDNIPCEDDLIVKSSVEIINPGDEDRFVNTIMDIIPISSKVLGIPGEGITHTMTGVYVMVTGVDEDGRQMHEFGSSEGMLKEKLKRNMAGTPGDDDIIIHLDFLIKGGQPYERKLPLAIFHAADKYIQELRDVLHEADGRNADEVHEFYDKRRDGALRIAVVKQVAGQGAMYDNMMFMSEPSGADGLSIIDMGNMPVILTPNEYRDGILRAMV